MLDMADDAIFLLPVVIDETPESVARVPEEFLQTQWTRLPGGETPPAFAQRVQQLLSGPRSGAHVQLRLQAEQTSSTGRRRKIIAGIAALAAVAVVAAMSIMYH